MDCQRCGACCTVYVVDLYACDYDDLPHPRRNLLVTVDSDGGHVMRVTKPIPTSGKWKAGRCAALAGKPGERVRCTVYDDRPTVCRQFEPEGEACNRARATARRLKILPVLEGS